MLLEKGSHIHIDGGSPPPVRHSSPSLALSRSPFSSNPDMAATATTAAPVATPDPATISQAILELKRKKEEGLRRLEALRSLTL